MSLPSEEREAFAEGRPAYAAATVDRVETPEEQRQRMEQWPEYQQQRQRYERQIDDQEQRRRLEEYRKQPELKPGKFVDEGTLRIAALSTSVEHSAD